jgi:hypothetical protein
MLAFIERMVLRHWKESCRARNCGFQATTYPVNGAKNVATLLLQRSVHVHDVDPSVALPHERPPAIAESKENTSGVADIGARGAYLPSQPQPCPKHPLPAKLLSRRLGELATQLKKHREGVLEHQVQAPRAQG